MRESDKRHVWMRCIDGQMDCPVLLQCMSKGAARANPPCVWRQREAERAHRSFMHGFMAHD